MPMQDSLDAALSQLGYDDEMGAMQRGRQLGPRGRALLQSEVAPGVPKPGYKRLVTGLGIATFTPAARTAVLTVAPLKPLIIRKLVISVAPSAPAAARQVVIDSILIGSQAQQATGNSLPVQLFGEQTQDNGVQFDTATPGVPVQINLSHLGPVLGAGETIDVVIGAIVDTLG